MPGQSLSLFFEIESGQNLSVQSVGFALGHLGAAIQELSYTFDQEVKVRVEFLSVTPGSIYINCNIEGEHKDNARKGRMLRAIFLAVLAWFAEATVKSSTEEVVKQYLFGGEPTRTQQQQERDMKLLETVVVPAVQFDVAQDHVKNVYAAFPAQVPADQRPVGGETFLERETVRHTA
jgi:hypothetical protein